MPKRKPAVTVVERRELIRRPIADVFAFLDRELAKAPAAASR